MTMDEDCGKAAQAGWSEHLSQELTDSLREFAQDPTNPFLAYRTAGDLGQALLAGFEAPELGALYPRLLAPAMQHMAELALQVTSAASYLARAWRSPGGDEVFLAAESKAVMRSVHQLHCAWWLVCEGYLEADEAQRAQLDESHDLNRLMFELLKLRLEQEDARPILATAREFLEELKGRFPADSEICLWWYLAEDGAAAVAQELEGDAAEGAISALRAGIARVRQGILPGDRLGVAARKAALQTGRIASMGSRAASSQPLPMAAEGEGPYADSQRVLDLNPWRMGPLAAAASKEDEELEAPTQIQIAWFEKKAAPGDEKEVRHEIEGEGTYYICRRLTGDWRVLVDINREGGEAGSIEKVSLGTEDLRQSTERPTRWSLVISPPHDSARVRQLAFAPLSIIFGSGRAVRIQVLEGP